MSDNEKSLWFNEVITALDNQGMALPITNKWENDTLILSFDYFDISGGDPDFDLDNWLYWMYRTFSYFEFPIQFKRPEK